MRGRSAAPRLSAVLILVFGLTGALSARAASESDGVLTVGAVQFAVAEEIYQSAETFGYAVEETLKSVEAAAEREAMAASSSDAFMSPEGDIPSGGPFLDLVVFPEYTSAFLGLSVLSAADIAAIRADPAGNRRLIIQALMATHWDMVDVWKALSKEKPYAILAGSMLVADSTGAIRNRALLFHHGEIVWTQDKVFAGGPERVILGLETGRIIDAEPFVIDGFELVATICRDTYAEDWEKALGDADLWLDIKANEIPYTQVYYDDALAARLPNSPIDRGLTVSLSGSILGFHFTGPTEYLYDMGGIAGTDPYAENAVLIINMPRE